MVSMLIRPRVVGALRAAGARRMLHATRAARVEQPMSSAQRAEYPKEGFTSPLWRNGLLLAIGGAVLYRLYVQQHGDPSEGPNVIGEWIERFTTPADQLRENNRRHLEWSAKRAETQLLFQDAQKPEAHRLTFLPYVPSGAPHSLTGSGFEQYSQRGIPVGSNLSVGNDLNLNKDRT